MSALSEEASPRERDEPWGKAGCHVELDPYPDLGYPDVDPWPDRTAIPDTDAECRVLIDDAVSSLVAVRGGSPRDPGAIVSVLVSLAIEADARLPDAVADARDQGYTWDAIADRLATTVPAARHRYAWYARARPSFPRSGN